MSNFLFDTEPQNNLDSFIQLGSEVLANMNSIEFRNLYWKEETGNREYIKENVYCNLENISPQKYQLTVEYTRALINSDDLGMFKQYYGGPYITQVVVSQSEGIESIKIAHPSYLFFKDNERDDEEPIFADPSSLVMYNWNIVNPYIQVYLGNERIAETATYEQLMIMIQNDIKHVMRHMETVISNRKKTN